MNSKMESVREWIESLVIIPYDPLVWNDCYSTLIREKTPHWQIGSVCTCDQWSRQCTVLQNVLYFCSDSIQFPSSYSLFENEQMQSSSTSERHTNHLHFVQRHDVVVRDRNWPLLQWAQIEMPRERK